MTLSMDHILEVCVCGGYELVWCGHGVAVIPRPKIVKS